MCRHIWIFSTYKSGDNIFKTVCTRCGEIGERQMTAGVRPNHDLFLELTSQGHAETTLLGELICAESDNHMRHWNRVRQYILDHTDDSGL